MPRKDGTRKINNYKLPLLDDKVLIDGDYPLHQVLAAHAAKQNWPDIPPAINKARLDEDQLDILDAFFSELRQSHVNAVIEFILRVLLAGERRPTVYERGLRSIVLERIFPQSDLHDLPWRDIPRAIGCNGSDLFACKKEVMAAIQKMGIRRAAGLFF